jgi:hypothetical protein
MPVTSFAIQWRATPAFANEPQFRFESFRKADKRRLLNLFAHKKQYRSAAKSFSAGS